MNYYNDIDPYIVQWLKNLIDAGLIPKGDVDDRSVTEIHPRELQGYTGVHLFAGVGGWPLALRWAGWPDDQPVWTGSCPCQPLSRSGLRKGHADKRHLWPAFYRLITECRPAKVFGEQVSGYLGYEWIAGVRADLEATGYACGIADLCAAAIGAPHVRQRLYWKAIYTNGRRLQTFREKRSISSEFKTSFHTSSDTFISARLALEKGIGSHLPDHGLPASVEQCATKAYGNAIVPQVAAKFIEAFIE